MRGDAQMPHVELILIGIGSCIVFDVWQRIFQTFTSIPPSNWTLVGRWFIGLISNGRLVANQLSQHLSSNFGDIGLIANITFPRYNRGSASNANSASAAINKWLIPRVPEGCVIHSFKRSLRDRLRAVECPSDIIDAIDGWATAGVGQAYGLGYSLEKKLEWLILLEEQQK